MNCPLGKGILRRIRGSAPALIKNNKYGDGFLEQIFEKDQERMDQMRDKRIREVIALKTGITGNLVKKKIKLVQDRARRMAPTRWPNKIWMLPRKERK